MLEDVIKSRRVGTTSAAELEANRKLAWEEFSAGKLAVDSRPFKASIEITRNCNFKCVMCARARNPLHARYNPGFDMKPALFRKVLEELFPHLEYAHLQGYGETTVSPHWPEILEMCRPFADRVRFGLVTNLSRRDPAMWRTLVEMGFRIFFSCDGATPETFEKIRVGGRFARILENLKVIAQARRRRPGGRLYFHMALQRLNYREMPQMVDLAARCGADRVSFATVKGRAGVSNHLGRLASWVTRGRLHLGASIYEVPKDRLLAAKNGALERSRKTGIPIVIEDSYLAGLGETSSSSLRRPPRAERPQDYGEGIEASVAVALHQKCFKPYSYVVVDYKGGVGPCNHLIADENWKQMGALGRSSFAEIWNSPAYHDMRRKLLNALPDNGACRWCFAHRMAD